jgi:predicted  nucleic acid-binding Zn-ribbon protein
MNIDLNDIGSELHDLNINITHLSYSLDDIADRLDTIADRIAREEREMQQLRESIEEVLHRAQ